MNQSLSVLRQWILAGCFTFVMTASAQLPLVLKHSIPAPPVGAAGGARLGSSIAIETGFTAVGAPHDDTGAVRSGVVKVFDTVSGNLLHVLKNPSPGFNDQFGNAVAISGTWLVVGAFNDATGGNNSGRVYVYNLASGTPTTPTFTLAEPTPDFGDQFGFTVAISGMRVVVGAPTEDTGALNTGRAYVFDLNSGTPTVPTVILNNPEPEEGDAFGTAVSISGTRVAVGTPTDDIGVLNANIGSVYVYDVNGGTPTVPVTTLRNPGPGNGDSFGEALSISGMRLVVAARWEDTGGVNSGSAYVYDLAGGTPTVPVATLRNPGPAAGDFFGCAVAISGTRVVVGACNDSTGAPIAGSAYVYDVASGTPTVPITTLTNPAPAQLDQFGFSVAISGTRVGIGALGDDLWATDSGTAYTFNLAGGTPTIPATVLNNPSPSRTDLFGEAIAISGKIVVIGTDTGDGTTTNAGRAHVYDLGSSTPTVPLLTLTRPGLPQDDGFGFSVGISGRRIVVGALSDDNGASRAGKAYVFDLDSATPALPILTLTNPTPASFDFFGTSVGISGSRVVVGAYGEEAGGADSGRAYVYDLTSGTPGTPAFTLNNPAPAEGDFFGFAVAISGTRVVIGADGDGAGAAGAGSAYVYELTNNTPTVPLATLNNPAPLAGDAFGYSVAITGSRVVVGAVADDAGANDAGSAYVYDVAGGTPTVPILILTNPAPAVMDQFGWAVGISGTRVVVSAPFSNTNATDAGRAYVFDLSSPQPRMPLDTLNNPGPAINDQFGYAVAMDGNTVAIGTPNDDTVMPDKGFAYIYGPLELELISITRTGLGPIVLEGLGVPNAPHRLQASSNLSSGSFITISTNTANASGIVRHEDPATGSSQKFYRLAYP